MTHTHVAWRPFLVVLALVAAAAGALYLAVVLSSGPDGSPPAASSVAQDAAQQTGQEPVTLDDDIDFRVATYEVFLSRDPFQPLLPTPASTAAPGDPAPGDPVPGDPDPTPGDPNGDPDDPDPSDGCTQNAELVCDGRVVTLVDTFEDNGVATAVVRVDNEIFEVTAGQTFATNFRVRSVAPPCVELVFGDEAFQLCEGEAVLK